MASYINGVTDYIPQLQPFSPDLGYYAGALATKQGQYDQGLKKVNSIYSSVFNSSMMATENIERRNKYFKDIEQDVQKIAQTDLSIDQNTIQAQQLFDPILNDRDIVNDMVKTKKVQKAYQTGEEYRNCVDPLKCNGSYWEEGKQAVDYWVEEFQNSSSEERLRMQAPSYVPYQNVTQKAIKAAKDFGFNVQYDHAEGRYLVTDTNGQLLLGKDGNGILPQFLYGMFGNDDSIQKMYSTKAYVQRKQYSKQRALELGIRESDAESEYINNILPKTITKLNQSTRDLENLKAKTNADKTSLDVLVQQQGGSVEGDGIDDQYTILKQLVDLSQQSQVYHDQDNNLINATPNSGDLRQLRNRADNLVAQNLFQNDMLNSAYEYAMGTSKHEIKGADPYALAAYNNSLDLGKAITLKNIDQKNWIEQNVLEGKIDPNDANTFGYNIPMGLNISGSGRGNSEGALRRQVMQALSTGEITQEDLLNQGITKLDSPALQKIAKAGFFSKSTATPVANLAGLGREATSFQHTYFENAKVTGTATNNAVNMSSAFLVDTMGAMRKAYDNADAAWGKDSVAIKTKILLDAKDILQGTGINYNDIINGNAPLSVLDRVKPQALSAMADMAMNIRNKGISSRVYNSGWSDQAMADMQRANQTMTGLYKERSRDLQNALDNVLATNKLKLDNRDINLNQARMTAGLYSSIVSNDTMLPYTESKQKFITDAINRKFFQNDSDSPVVSPGGEYRVITGKTALQKADEFFEENYTTASKTINDKLTSFYNRGNDTEQGGTNFNKNSINALAEVSKPLSKDFKEIVQVVQGIKNNPEEIKSIFFGAGNNDVSDVQTNTDKLELFGLISEAIDKGDKKTKISMTMQDIPRWLNQSPFSTENALNEAVQKNPGNTDFLPGQFHEESVLIGLTLDEDTYKESLGLKRSDVVDQSTRTVWIKTPAESPAVTPFLSRIRKSPEDIYMQREGAVQSVDLGPKGSLAVVRRYDKSNNSHLDMTLNIPYFNPNTGKMETIRKPPETVTLDEKGNYKSLSLKEAFDVAIDRLNTAKQINDAKIKRYLENSGQGR